MLQLDNLSFEYEAKRWIAEWNSYMYFLKKLLGNKSNSIRKKSKFLKEMEKLWLKKLVLGISGDSPTI